MPMGYFEYVEPIVQKRDRTDYFQKYYENRKQHILNQQKQYHQSKKKRLIPEIIVDFSTDPFKTSK